MTQIEIFCYIPEVLGHFALQSVFSPALTNFCHFIFNFMNRFHCCLHCAIKPIQ